MRESIKVLQYRKVINKTKENSYVLFNDKNT